MEKQRERQAGRPGEREGRSVQMEKDRKNALLQLSRSHIRKAVRTITSYGIGDMSDPDILQQMEEKYPDRGIPLPGSVSRGQCIDNLRGLSDVLLSLKGGVSPGTGGMRNEYLTCLAETWGEHQMSLLEDFGMRYLNGQLPPWW